MTRGRIVLVSALGVTAVLVGLAVLTLQHGFSARDEPSPWEKAAARSVRRLAVPRAARYMRDPLAVTPDNLDLAMQFWATSCATCHGNNGSGHTTIGHNVYPKPPDLRRPDTQNLTDGELYYVIRNGIRLSAMPAWGPPATNGEPATGYADLWRLVQIIRHLPQLTPEEEAAMRKMNPKVPATVADSASQDAKH